MNNEKIKNHSVWIATVNKKGEVTNRYIPLLDIEIKEGTTLNYYLEQNEKDKQGLRNEVKELSKQLSNLAAFFNDYRNATEKSFSDVLDEINKEKFL